MNPLHKTPGARTSTGFITFCDPPDSEMIEQFRQPERVENAISWGAANVTSTSLRRYRRAVSAH
jgi:hypothetical protein